jgi:hypothetical protein
MSTTTQARTPMRIGVAASAFTLLGVSGLMFLETLPYHISGVQESNAGRVYALALVGLICAILTSAVMLLSRCREPHRMTRIVAWACLLVSVSALADLHLNPKLGVHSVLTARNVCLNNARKIEGAKESWAQQSGATNGAPVTWNDIAPFLPNGMPSCPEGGKYQIGRVGEQVTCSQPNHRLQ